jgi:hypothetical protein
LKESLVEGNFWWCARGTAKFMLPQKDAAVLWKLEGMFVGCWLVSININGVEERVGSPIAESRYIGIVIIPDERWPLLMVATVADVVAVGTGLKDAPSKRRTDPSAK